jgi:hypothetical protein
LSIIVISPLILAPYTTPIGADIIVLMSRDSSTMDAADEIDKNSQNVITVEYGSLQYGLAILRSVGKVIWISHGSEDGIISHGALIDWAEFANSINSLPGKDIVLACHSEIIYERAPTAKPIAIGGNIDAILGGLIVSWLIRPNPDILGQAVNRAYDLSTGIEEPRTLYWSWQEKAWAAIDTGILMMSALCTTFAIWKGSLNVFSLKTIFSSLLTVGLQLARFAEILVGFFTGTMGAWTLATKFASLFVSVLWAIFVVAPWYVQAIAGSEVIISISTGARIVSALLILLGLGSLIHAILSDQSDSNSIYGRYNIGF